MKLTILGIPLQKQSAKFFRRGNFIKSYQPENIVNWQAQAKQQILEQLPKNYIPIKNPILISEVTFVFPPVKSMRKKTINEIELYEKECGNPVYKSTKPDWDNLCKNIFDCCNGLVWNDDSQIVEVNNIKKIYGNKPRIDLTFEEIKNDA